MQLKEETILTDLIHQQRVKTIDTLQQEWRLTQETQSLKALSARTENFLNQYDQLFRYISIWLLIRGYDLTNHQPHQVLKAVCVLQCPQYNVEQIIRQRHQLKKEQSSMVEPALVNALQNCLQHFQQRLHAYLCAVA